jgi:hypothetical protein
MMAMRYSALNSDRPLNTRMVPGTHFCYTLNLPQDYSAIGRIRTIEKSSDRYRNRNRDLPDCTILSSVEIRVITLLTRNQLKKTKLHGLSQRANYIDRENAACRRS